VRRLLGVDLGDRRVGLAVADGDGTPARPLATIRRATAIAGDVDVIGRLASEHGIEELVVGLPLHAHGDEGSQAAAARAWAETVAAGTGLPLTMRDERLSSHRAEQRVGPMKRGRSGGPPTPSQREAYRSRIDREAAAIILQDELDERAARGGEAAAPRAPDPSGGMERHA
jgi:putative Holliday junction resolvase